ncbi:MAG: hypothetical protein LBS48_04910 [Treponema sp.]|jgi:hypothetical protein|nr:hypothetical protein [Treponema sp.]
METFQKLPEIKAVLLEKAKILRELSDQAFHLETQIRRIAGSIYSPERELSRPAVLERNNIIPFPVKEVRAASTPKAEKIFFPVSLSSQFQVPILAKPGNPMPESIPDFRPMLQRDGLILLSWDKRITGNGERYTAYWVTSAGICRYYASKALDSENFASAQPARKSYAAEDGIEFYGQSEPSYIVYVVPELMMSNPNHTAERGKCIKKLKALGVQSDFDYMYLLTREKKKKTLCARKGALDRRRNGA